MSNQAYIFDMDGVLVNNCRYHVLAWRVFSKKHGFELTDEQVLEWMGAANRVYMERLLGRPVTDDELTALENEKESLYRELYAPPAGLAGFFVACFASPKRVGKCGSMASRSSQSTKSKPSASAFFSVSTSLPKQ